MKLKTHRILLLLLLCSMAEIGMAQVARLEGDIPGPSKNNPALKGLRNQLYEYSHYMMGVYADCGYSAMIPQGQLSALPGGYTTGIGFHFEYMEKIFLTQVGLSVRWQDVNNYILSGSTFDSKVVNPDNPDDLLPAKFSYEARYDESRNLYVQLPVMLGLNFRGYYFLVGPKLSYLLSNGSNYHLKNPTASVDFFKNGNYLPVEVREKPTSVALLDSTSYLKSFDVMASVELGYEWVFESKNRASFGNRNNASQRIRLAFFADFGLIDIHKQLFTDSYEPLEPNSLEFVDPYIWSSFTHAGGSNAVSSLRNCFAGVRLTYTFYDYRFSHKSYKIAADRRHRSRRVH